MKFERNESGCVHMFTFQSNPIMQVITYVLKWNVPSPFFFISGVVSSVCWADCHGIAGLMSKSGPIVS